MMKREQALRLYKSIPDGVAKHRSWYAKHFPVGSAAQAYWRESLFMYGIEYGMLIALARAFDITPEEFGFDKDEIKEATRWAK